MPRDVYYQSSENPIQLDRLPRRLPEIELPVASGSIRWPLGILGAAILLQAIGVLIGLLFEHIGDEDGRYVWHRLLLLLICGALIYRAHQAHEFMWLGKPLIIAVIVWFCLNVSLPTSVRIFPATIFLGMLTWNIGRHWTALCTTSPCDREQARSLRETWSGYLRVVSLAPTAIAVLCLVVGNPDLAIAAIALAMTTQVVQALQVQDCRKIPRIAFAAVHSFLSYNHQDRRLPGTFQSPAGVWSHRVALISACGFLLTVNTIDAIHDGLRYVSPADSDPPSLKMLVTITAAGTLVPIVATFAIPAGLTLPLLVEAANCRRKHTAAKRWASLVKDIQNSRDPIERRSIFRGRVAADGSPLLVPYRVFCEHAHFLGDSGSGKTSMGLAPTIEQLFAFGNCSLVVIDLKADSMELLATLYAAARDLRRRTGQAVTIKHFSNQTRRSTFAFNPLTQPCWKHFDLYTRTDILCGALGLHYGADYGEGFYSATNAAVSHHTMKHSPDVTTFRELADRIGYIVANAKRHELHPEVRKAGVHVQEVFKRLGTFEALNVTSDGRHPPDVFEHAIDLSEAFRTPQILYFHLSASLSPGASPELARLITYFLLTASAQTERRQQVFLVIDEFQRMVARNIEYMLQLARSMGVGIILANQSMQDLKTSKADLIPAIEANCRYREWFAVSGTEDRRQLIASSGETVETTTTWSESTTSDGGTTSSVSETEHIVPRFSVGEVALTSDHPHRSIVKVARGDGYAQYGGLPLIVANNYHITRDEYQRRKAFSWPEATTGTLVPLGYGANGDAPSSPSGPVGPIVTTEVIGEDESDAEPLPDDPFDAYRKGKRKQNGRRKRRRRRENRDD